MSASKFRRPSPLAWMVLLLSFGLLACQPTTPSVTWEENAGLLLELRSMRGEPVADAEVLLPSGERLRTDVRGQLLLKNLPRGRQVLQVEAEGFASTAVAVDVNEGVRAGTRLDLLPLGPPAAVFNTNEGAVFDKGGISVTVPPGDLVDAEGRPIRGEVEAYLAPLNLEDLEKAELLAAPGVLQGQLRPNEPPVNLESVGLMVLIFKQKAGQGVSAQSSDVSALVRGSRGVTAFARRLGVRGKAPGSVLASSYRPPGGGPVAFKLGALSGSTVSQQVPVWRLDTTSGRWIPTGDLGTLRETSPGSRQLEWSFELTHPIPIINVALPFWWRSASASKTNPLQPPAPAWLETACLAVQVEDEEGQPVAGRTVVAQGVNYVSVSRAVTDVTGRALLEVMRDKVVQLDAGAGATRLPTGSAAGTCTRQGAEPTPVTLRVPAPACTPGAERDCDYGGPKGTRNVGVCRASRQSCDVNGAGWSDTCEGEVLPQEDACDNSLDDDCDGVTNESCESVCEQGETLPCYGGPEGTEGVGLCQGGTQKCLAGGTAWSACEGRVLPRAEDCSSSQDENCDGVACQCWPGETQPCAYTGPAGTEGVGTCRAGTRTCDASGTGWSACTGEVLPQTESCANLLDDDCNGLENDSLECVCQPGTSKSCYEGPDGTKNVGLCQMGLQTCAASGTDWGECLGDVLPLAEEDCTTPGDDDCDGVENEGTVCVCTPNATKGCYEGPTGTENVGVCKGGTQQCNASGTAWSTCTDVRPQPESCTSPQDEDCDGQRNESPTCGWVQTTSMISARFTPSGVVLNDGHVLVLGGTDSSGGALETAWVYDPVALTWTSTDGNMTSKRRNPGAVLLNDGRVLVMGGWNGVRLNTSELYEPTARTWTAVGQMGSVREFHTTTLLSNGKVLVAGGVTGSSQLNTAEVYDPDPLAKTWSPTANFMTSPRALHAATLLNDGRVLVTGGHLFDNTRLTLAEVYNPNDKTWSAVASMNHARTGHTSTLLSNGRVLVVGGSGNGPHVAIAEEYDPVANTWTNVGALTRVRDEHRAVLLNNGHVLVTGGDDGSTATATAETYDPLARTWTTVAALTTTRTGHLQVLLDTGEVLVVGGGSTTAASSALATAELYNPTPATQAGSWMLGKPMGTRRHKHTATVLANGKVLVAGGNNGTDPLQSAEVYDPATHCWSPTDNTLAVPRENHTATLLNDGKVLVVGGRAGTTTNTAELYDPTTNRWSATGALTWARDSHTATLSATGKVLVTGGRADGTTTSTAELYDPGSGTWSPISSLSEARIWHTATLLPGGEVFVAGGNGNGGALQLDSAAVYESSLANTWSSANDTMAQARDWHTATLLANGQVLVAGGYDAGGFLQGAELYDPGSGDASQGTWSTTGALTTGRREHAATLLTNGKVLVTGGLSTNSVSLQSAELYDAGTGTWSSVNDLFAPLDRHTSTLLNNGKVLVTGGHNSTGVLNTVQLYSP